MALTLALPLPLTLTLALALPLTLTLALTCAARVRAALALPLPLARPGTALCLALALTLALALALLPLTGRLPARVREVATGILQSGRRSCQVACRGDATISAGQRLTQPVERLTSPCGVALRQALGGLTQRRPGGSVRLRCRRLEGGQLAGELALLLGRQPVELVAEVLEVVVRLLRIPVRVRLGLAGRGARQRPAERGQRRGALLVGGIDLGAHVCLDRPEAGEVRVEVVRALAQLAREIAQLLGQSRPRILGIATLVREVLGDPVDPLGLSFCSLADLLLLGDHRVLWVRQERDRHEEKSRQQGDRRRLPREPRPEQAGRRRADRAQGVAALAADESVGLGGLVDRSGRRRAPRSSSAGPTRPGKATASSSALDTRSPSAPSASTASAVSPIRGRARIPATSQPSRPTNGIAAPSTGALERHEPGDRPETQLRRP